jgi:hypothetical protein
MVAAARRGESCILVLYLHLFCMTACALVLYNDNDAFAGSRTGQAAPPSSPRVLAVCAALPSAPPCAVHCCRDHRSWSHFTQPPERVYREKVYGNYEITPEGASPLF